MIRLFRVGKKNQPSFKIVVTQKEKPPRAGRFLEQVGFWNPLTKQKNLSPDRIKYWLSVGAHPSDTVFNMLVSEKIVEGKKISLHKKPKKEAAVSPATPKPEQANASVAEKKEEASSPVPQPNVDSGV